MDPMGYIGLSFLPKIVSCKKKVKGITDITPKQMMIVMGFRIAGRGHPLILF